MWIWKLFFYWEYSWIEFPFVLRGFFWAQKDVLNFPNKLIVEGGTIDILLDIKNAFKIISISLNLSRFDSFGFSWTSFVLFHFGGFLLIMLLYGLMPRFMGKLTKIYHKWNQWYKPVFNVKQNKKKVNFCAFASWIFYFTLEISQLLNCIKLHKTSKHQKFIWNNQKCNKFF